MTHKAGIVGFRGYSGAELVSLLQRHPHVEPLLMEHRSDAAHESVLRHPKGPRQVAATADAVRAEKIGIVFLATPAEVSMELAPAMLDAGARVVDLSGAFRLRTVENYDRWYREPHTQPALLSDGRQSGDPAAARGGRHRPRGGHRLRCEVRRQRRG